MVFFFVSFFDVLCTERAKKCFFDGFTALPQHFLSFLFGSLIHPVNLILADIGQISVTCGGYCL